MGPALHLWAGIQPSRSWRVHADWLGSRNAVNVGVDVRDFQPITLADARRRAAKLAVNKRWADVEPRNAGEE